MKIDMNKLVALVKGTKGLLTDKQAVSQVTIKGVSDYAVSYTHLLRKLINLAVCINRNHIIYGI